MKLHLKADKTFFESLLNFDGIGKPAGNLLVIELIQRGNNSDRNASALNFHIKRVRLRVKKGGRPRKNKIPARRKTRPFKLIDFYVLSCQVIFSRSRRLFFQKERAAFN